MRRLPIVVILSLLLMFAIGTVVSSAAQRRTSSSRRIPLQALSMQLEKAKPLAPTRIPLRLSARATLRKLVKRVNQLTAGYNALVEAHNRLVSEITTCFGKQPVTRWSGYWFGEPAFPTSAIDFSEPGDQVSAVMATVNC